MAGINEMFCAQTWRLFPSCSVVANNIQLSASKTVKCPHEQHNVCLSTLYCMALQGCLSSAALVQQQRAPLPLPPSRLLHCVYWQIADRLQRRTLTTTASNCLASALSPIWYIAGNINIRPKCIIFHWKWYCSTTREFIPKKIYYLQLLTSVLVLWVDGDTLGLPWFAETVMTKMWCCLW